LADVILVVKQVGNGGGVGFNLGGDAARQLVDIAHVVEGDFHGTLKAATQHVDQAVVAHAVFHDVATGVDVLGVFLFLRYPIEALLVDQEAGIIDEALHLFEVGACGDEQLDVFATGGFHIG
jgi:hypothetical protein